ncbi:MAG: hypothetical protein WBG53_01785, partial [Rhodococcus sp. (in: high G+C Gram-positive bacteria)]
SVTVLANLSANGVGVADAVPANAAEPTITAADTTAQPATALDTPRPRTVEPVVALAIVSMSESLRTRVGDSTDHNGC